MNKLAFLSAVSVSANGGSLSAFIVTVALGLAFVGAPLAQTAQTSSTVDVRKFEVIGVDGNKLVVRDEKGTEEYTVPDDFRFTVDGKKMSVSELKPGMKGTATVTTTTTIKPVVVTELREGEVLRASSISMTVRTADGTRRFTQGELDAKGIEIFKDGNPVRLSDLRRGDRLSATIITDRPPVVLTEKEVQATLDEPTAEPAPTKVAAAAPAPAAPPPASAAPPASQPAESSGLGLTWYVLIAALIAVVVFVIVRRRKQT
jgi:hypothetical protein